LLIPFCSCTDFQSLTAEFDVFSLFVRSEQQKRKNTTTTQLIMYVQRDKGQVHYGVMPNEDVDSDWFLCVCLMV
jgi:hypothetical protein